MKKAGFVLVLLTAFSSVSFGQAGISAVPFLQISPDSRSGGFGEGGVAMAGKDPYTIYWNPAALYRIENVMVSITHANWLPQLTSDLFYDYLAFTLPMGEGIGTLGGHITYLNLGENVRTSETGDELGRFGSWEIAAGVSYGIPLDENWSVGFGARFIQSQLSPFATAGEKGKGIASGFGVDLATEWHPQELYIETLDLDLSNAIRWGLNISNIGPKLTYIDEDQADPLPTMFRTGLAYKWLDDEYYSLETHVEFAKLMVAVKDTAAGTRYPVHEAIVRSWVNDGFGEELRKANIIVGGEFVYDKFVALRAGYFYEDSKYGNRKFITYGAGLVYAFLNVDFSYISTFEESHPLAGTLRFSLGLDINKL